MNENTVGEKAGYTYGFLSYTDDQYRILSNDLNLGLSVGELKYCAKYFRSSLPRYPSVSELLFISRFVGLFRGSPFTLTPYNLRSDDTEVFETFEDINEKYSVLFPDKNTPMTYADAVAVADEYIKRCGKESILPDNIEFTTDNESQLISKRSLKLVDIGSDRFKVIKKYSNKIRINNNDFYACILGNDALVNDTIRSLINESKISLAESVGEFGILYSLLRISESLNLNMEAISEIFGYSERDDNKLLSLLCEIPEKYAFVVRFSRQNARAVTNAIDSIKGVEMKFIGIAEKSKYFTARRSDNTVILRLSIDFLRSLAFLCHIEDTVNQLSYERIKPLSESICETLSIGNKHYIAAENCVTTKGSYINSVYGVLDTVGKLIEKGCNAEEIELFAKYDYPSIRDRRDFYSHGEGLSSLLGVYRVKAELAIGGRAECTFSSSDIPKIYLTAYSKTPKKAVCNELSGGDRGKIYLLETSYSHEKLPDFENLRELMAYLNKLISDGTISAVKYVGGIAIGDLAKAEKIQLDDDKDTGYVPAFAFAVKTQNDILGVPFGSIL